MNSDNTVAYQMSVVRLRRKGGVEVQSCEVYIGRQMTMGGWNLKTSKWANPFKVGSAEAPTVEVAVLKYWLWFHEPEQKQLRAEAVELKGRILGCWCRSKGSEPCHGDVLAFAANGGTIPAPLRAILEKAAVLLPTIRADQLAVIAEMLGVKPLIQPQVAVATPSPRVHLDRVRAALVGAILGDALGVPHEFPKFGVFPYTGKLEHRYVHKAGVRFGHPSKTLAVGQYSDDSEMSLILARSLIKNQKYDHDDVITGYIKWAHSDQPMMGRNTKDLFKLALTKKDPTGIDHYKAAYIKKFGFDPAVPPFSTTTKEAESAQSNGALMRCMPLACWWREDYGDVWCSNPSTVARDAERLQINALRFALAGVDAKTTRTHVQQWATEWKVGPELQAVIADVIGLKSRKLEINRGWVCNSLYTSFACLNALATDSTTSYSVLMKWVIDGHPGSDTDTNACIAGALVGAFAGWDALLAGEKDNIVTLITSTAGTVPTDVPRPKEYQLGDLEELARGLTMLSGY